ncbi:YkgJ family cysteine cluster protein [Geoglobus acetivorans]|uniref:YkgJ family cysteine cluster protein n=1 Tax=Geoglobus acetivorans TaxID=565033 RepID=A0A0A7GJC2_GEOAI|nr:hypothetical protein GACE_1997 [Geoglobus acetivorans]
MDLAPYSEFRRWRCIHCGYCCREYDISLGYEDERILRKFGSVFSYGKIGVYLKRRNSKCIFRKNRCKIYRFRPVACRKYPFYIRNSGDKRSEFMYNGKRYYILVDRNCRGLGMGEDIEKAIVRLLRWIERHSPTP